MQLLPITLFVIPAKAGIHGLTFPGEAPACNIRRSTMDSRLRGNDKAWSL